MRWFQAYLPGEDDRIEAMVERVQAAGYDTFVLTADVPVPANRENNVRTGFAFRSSPRCGCSGMVFATALALRHMARHLHQEGRSPFREHGQLQGAAILSRSVVRAIGARDQLSWRHLALIRRLWPGRLIVKGVLSPQDAVFARENGADGVIVSNHGGRQLDGARPALAALPSIAEVAGAA